MKPLYATFCEAEGWGTSAIYEQGIQALYSFIVFNSPEAAIQFVPKFEEWFPDLDAFESTLTSYAFDASVALTEALLFASTQDEAHFTNHLTAATDCIDMFVQDLLDLDPNRPDLNEVIDAHEYMQREYARRERLNSALMNFHISSLDNLNQIRLLNGNTPLVDLARLVEL